MKTLSATVVVVAVAAVAATGGYWLGFRHAFDKGLLVDGPARGAIAMHQILALEKGKTDNLRISFESDIDVGLASWALLESYPLFGGINALSGRSVVPDTEKYVRRIATYRKNHPSPLRDPTLVAQMLENVRESDPQFAKDLEEGGLEMDMEVDRIIQKYAE